MHQRRLVNFCKFCHEKKRVKTAIFFILTKKNPLQKCVKLLSKKFLYVRHILRKNIIFELTFYKYTYVAYLLKYTSNRMFIYDINVYVRSYQLFADGVYIINYNIYHKYLTNICMYVERSTHP